MENYKGDITVMTFSFGRCYLYKNELIRIRYDHLKPGETQPSFTEVLRSYFDPEDDEYYGDITGKPPLRFQGTDRLDDIDLKYLEREIPEYLI